MGVEARRIAADLFPGGAALTLGVAAAPAQAQVADRSAVTPWIELELDAIASHRTNPPRASRALAHVSVAMYLAALAGAVTELSAERALTISPGGA